MSANGPAFTSPGVVEPHGLRRIWLCLVCLGVALIVLGFAALLGATAPSGASDAAALKAGVFEPARVAPDFTLQGSDGSELKLSRYRGKVGLDATTACPWRAK